MIKKIIVLLTISCFIACGSKKAVVATTKKAATTIKKPVVVVNKPIEPKPKVVVQDQKPVETSPTPTNQNPEQIEILEATTRVKVTTAMVLDYIEKYKQIAKDDMKQFGIPASIILGQGILESGAGTGPLSVQANNHFGIKCHKEWTGASVRYNDDEPNECFRKYNNPAESYKDHTQFLSTRDRYAFLFTLPKNDYKGWARGLKTAGYATDPAYPSKLIGLVERYNLGQYDAEVLGTDYVSPTKTTNNQQPTTINLPTINYLTHQVEKGDTLFSISKKYNITVDDLKKKNNITDNSISIGQMLIIN